MVTVASVDGRVSGWMLGLVPVAVKKSGDTPQAGGDDVPYNCRCQQI